MISSPDIIVASVIDRTEAEGPGVRFAVWTQGCPMRCRGCCNPELLPFRGGQAVTADGLAARALASGSEGVSLLGGEPFAQAAALVPFAAACRSGGMSVMAYSGYTIDEIRSMPDAAAARLLSLCDLLVDGRYDASRPEARRRWVGSSNQTMHFLTGRYREDDPAFVGANTIEIRVGDGGELTINGWPAFGAATGREITGAR